MGKSTMHDLKVKSGVYGLHQCKIRNYKTNLVIKREGRKRNIMD